MQESGISLWFVFVSSLKRMNIFASIRRMNFFASFCFILCRVWWGLRVWQSLMADGPTAQELAGCPALLPFVSCGLRGHSGLPTAEPLPDLLSPHTPLSTCQTQASPQCLASSCLYHALHQITGAQKPLHRMPGGPVKPQSERCTPGFYPAPAPVILWSWAKCRNSMCLHAFSKWRSEIIVTS